MYKLSEYTVFGLQTVVEGSFCWPRLMIGESLDPNSLVFVMNADYFDRAYNDDNVSCIICSEQIQNHIPALAKKGIAISTNPKFSFYSIHNSIVLNSDKCKNRKTVIGNNTQIHTSSIVANEGVIIGNDCIIEENVIIRSGTQIGDNTVIRAGSIIGTDNDLNYYNNEDDLCAIESGGTVLIKNNCEIGYYTTIARGMMIDERTIIEDHVFIGAKVAIGHNVVIGRNSDVVDGTQICGYTTIGHDSHIAPQSIISNKLKLGNSVYVTIGSCVVNNLKSGSIVAGNFAIDKEKFMKWHLRKIRNQ